MGGPADARTNAEGKPTLRALMHQKGGDLTPKWHYLRRAGGERSRNFSREGLDDKATRGRERGTGLGIIRVIGRQKRCVQASISQKEKRSRIHQERKNDRGKERADSEKELEW